MNTSNEWEKFVLLGVLVLLIGGMLLVVAFAVDDFTAATVETHPAPIERHEFEPSQVITTWISNGKTMTPNVMILPDQYSLVAEGHSCEVTKELHDAVKDGDWILLETRKTRLFKRKVYAIAGRCDKDGCPK